MDIRVLLAGPLLGLMLTAAGQSYGRGTQEEVLDDLSRPGKEAFLKENYRVAELYFQEASKEAEARSAPAKLRASILSGLALTLLTQGRFTEAEGVFSRALEIAEQEVVEPRTRPILLLNLAWLHTQTYRYGRAESLLKETLALGNKQFGAESVFVAAVLKNLGILYASTTREKLAEESLKKALTIAEKHAVSHPQDFATSLASFYASRKQWNKAESLLARSVEVLGRSVGPDHSSMSAALNSLGELYALQNKFSQAEMALRQALRIRQRIFGPDNLSVAFVSCRLAVVLTAQGKYAEANSLFLSSLSIQERVLGPKSPDLVVALEEFATLLRKMDNSSQAETVEARAKDIRFELMYTVSANRLGK